MFLRTNLIINLFYNKEIYQLTEEVNQNLRPPPRRSQKIRANLKSCKNIDLKTKNKSNTLSYIKKIKFYLPETIAEYKLQFFVDVEINKHAFE